MPTVGDRLSLAMARTPAVGRRDDGLTTQRIRRERATLSVEGYALAPTTESASGGLHMSQVS